MGAWKNVVHVAWSGLFISMFLGATLPVAAQQAVDSENVSQKREDAPTNHAKIVELPDSPGALVSKSGGPADGTNSTEQRWELTSAASQPGQSQAQSQPSETQPQSAPQKPVGTAAAEAPNATGIAASQPAGVAIAPAKQRRVRTIVLRMGAIVGAGVAVGSVVALTAGTSSKPPGAH